MKVSYLKERRLNREDLAVFREIIAQSFCIVRKFTKDSRMVGLWIEFGGDAANIPSVSNARQIAWCIAKGGKKRPIIRKTSNTIGRLEAMSHLFTEAVVKEGIGIPSFGETEVQVTALLAKRGGRWDSHNATKAIGDWLESVGILHDDQQAEIFTVKKSDYFDDTEILGTTQLIIQPKQQVKSVTKAYIYDVKKASTGYEFIG